jgi:hypothetical protein
MSRGAGFRAAGSGNQQQHQPPSSRSNVGFYEQQQQLTFCHSQLIFTEDFTE